MHLDLSDEQGWHSTQQRSVTNQTCHLAVSRAALAREPAAADTLRISLLIGAFHLPNNGRFLQPPATTRADPQKVPISQLVNLESAE